MAERNGAESKRHHKKERKEKKEKKSSRSGGSNGFKKEKKVHSGVLSALCLCPNALMQVCLHACASECVKSFR